MKQRRKFYTIMPDYIDPDQLKRNILNDMRVELADEFDRNFERKAFFTRKWKPRRINSRGSLLIVTGALHRSIKAEKLKDGQYFKFKKNNLHT